MDSKRTTRTYQESVQSSLKFFLTVAWPVIEPSTQLKTGLHIDAVVEHLEAVTRGQIQNLLINLPPRHMKSLTVSVFWPVWEWIAHPHRRWLFASYASPLSIRDSVRCRRLIESDWFQSLFGDKFQLTTDQNQKMRFDNDKGGCRIATSVGGSATGEGGDRVVVDDPHNVSQRESDAIRRATLAWWDQTMSTRLNDPRNGARVIVMQRIHEKDLSGHVLEQGGYVHLCLPAEYDPGRRCVTRVPWGDWRTTEGQLLWPERISKSEIADFKLRLGPSGYAGQFQQCPVPAGGARFNRDWFRYFQLEDATKPDTEDRVTGKDQESGNTSDSSLVSPPHPLTIPQYVLLNPNGATRRVRVQDCWRFAVMDPAGTEPEQNSRPCYTVIQVWDVTPAHEMLLVHQFRRQVQAPDAAAAAERIARDFDVHYLAVEKDGLGLGIVQTLKRTGVSVRAIRARGSKEARSEIAEIRMAAGMIYFPRDASFLWDLEQELIHFPRGEYADQVDALAHAAMQVQRRSGPVRQPMADDEPAAADPVRPEADGDWA